MRSKMPPFYPFDPEPDFDTALEVVATADKAASTAIASASAPQAAAWEASSIVVMPQIFTRGTP